MIKFLILLFVVTLPQFLFADENKNAFKNASELAISLSSGNSSTETYLLKQDSSYNYDMNIFSGHAKLVRAQSKDATTEKYVESANNWEAGLKYEREFSKYFAAFIAHTVSHDRFAGYIQRNVWDIGPKYYWIKKDHVDWFTELGYRNTYDYNVDGSGNPYSSIRLYDEWNQKWSETLSSKLWTEYIPTLDDKDDDTFGEGDYDYQFNFEGSITSALSSIFSLKMAYLGKYDNEPNVEGAERYDSLYTASLIANW